MQTFLHSDPPLGHFVPFWTRYVKVFQVAREMIQSGELGEIRSTIFRWHNPRPPNMPLTWRDNPELSSAGTIADVGSHAYDTIRWMIGLEAEKVLAHGQRLTHSKPDLGEINLREASEPIPQTCQANQGAILIMLRSVASSLMGLQVCLFFHTQDRSENSWLLKLNYMEPKLP